MSFFFAYTDHLLTNVLKCPPQMVKSKRKQRIGWKNETESIFLFAQIVNFYRLSDCQPCQVITENEMYHWCDLHLGWCFSDISAAHHQQWLRQAAYKSKGYRQQWKKRKVLEEKSEMESKVQWTKIITGTRFTKKSHYSAWLFMYLLQPYPNLCGLGSGQGFPCLCYFFPAKLISYAVSVSGEWCSVLFVLAFKWVLSWQAHLLLDNSMMLLFKSLVLELQDTLWHTKPDQALEVLTKILCAVKLYSIYQSVLIALTMLCILCMPTRVHTPFTLKCFFGGVS